MTFDASGNLLIGGRSIGTMEGIAGLGGVDGFMIGIDKNNGLILSKEIIGGTSNESIEQVAFQPVFDEEGNFISQNLIIGGAFAVGRYSLEGRDQKDIYVITDQGFELMGNDMDNYMQGGGGNDSISSGAGDDTLVGGSGNDTVAGGVGNDLIVGGNGAGDDVYFGGGGIDTVKYTSANAGITVNLSAALNQAKSTQANLAGIGLDQLSGIENIIASYHDDMLTGNSVNNVFFGLTGNDLIDGGANIDTAVYSGSSTQYSISIGSTSSQVVDSIIERDGNDNLANIERLQFTDTNIALDIADTAGQAYRIYEAVLGRAPDLEGLGYWINDMDNGVSLTTIAKGFIASTEFQGKYGANPTYETYLNLLYNNILDRAPDPEGLNYWLTNMQNGIDSPAVVLASFSEGYENTANVALDIANGIYYTAWIT
jgi:Ca2+-binding RTX toxin-like protein